MFGVNRLSVVRSLRSFSRLLHYVQGQSPEPRVREYFYYIDHQGQLFLDNARIKNFTSCFKEKDFLQFFFSRLERNRSESYAEHFPYLSLCGRERNFIRCDDVPVVFTELLPAAVQLKDVTAVQLKDFTAEQLSSAGTAPTQLSISAKQLVRQPEAPQEATLAEDPPGVERTRGGERRRRSGRVIDPASDHLSYCGAGERLVYPFSPSEISMLPSTGRVYHPGPERAGGVGLVNSALAIEFSKLFEFRDGEGMPPTHFRWKDKTYVLTNNVLKRLEELHSSGV